MNIVTDKNYNNKFEVLETTEKLRDTVYEVFNEAQKEPDNTVPLGELKFRAMLRFAEKLETPDTLSLTLVETLTTYINELIATTK